MVDPTPLDAILEAALAMAEAAGQLALEGLSSQPQIDFKGRRELVTPVDKACEALIVERIQAEFPTHGYFAEEGHVTEDERPYRWIVDPIDGTTNYAHRLPAFARPAAHMLGLDIFVQVEIGLEILPRGAVVEIIEQPPRLGLIAQDLAHHRLGESPVHLGVGQQQDDLLLSQDRAEQFLHAIDLLEVDGHAEHQHTLRVVDLLCA